MQKRRQQLSAELSSLFGPSAGWKPLAALALIVAFIVALIAIAIVGNLSIGFRPQTYANRPIRAGGPNERFALLGDRHSNRCSLRADSVTMLSAAGRLQGACCAPMNLAHYKRQLRGLRDYRAVPLVPADPYDVSVRLAARLIAYDRSIQLGPPERRLYDQAVRLSKEHGPCCCQCWRWSAFAGQAKGFILEQRYSAEGIAAIWGLEDGCGGQA
jgi:hypothetical protein